MNETIRKDSPQLALYSLAAALFAAISAFAILSLLGLQPPVDSQTLAAGELSSAGASAITVVSLVLSTALAGLFLVLGFRRARR